MLTARKVSSNMKKRLLAIVLLILLLLGIGVGYWYYNYKHTLENVRAGDLTINGSTLVVEVANDSLLRTTGLSGREKLEQNAGMLFVFNKPGFYDFWMKDMKFALDLVWFDSDWKVVDVTQDFKPETYPNTVTSKKEARYVIEVNSGFVKAHSITEGNTAYFEGH